MKAYKIIVSFILFIIISLQCSAQESKFKALFIYKFAEYIQWPAEIQTKTVGIVGSSEVFTELSAFAASKGNMTVIRIKSPAESNKCEIVFLPSTLDKLIEQYTSAIGNQGVLLVSESSTLVGKGSDIGFYLENGKLRFLISEEDIRSKKMTPSAKLLTLGKSI